MIVIGNVGNSQRDKLKEGN